MSIMFCEKCDCTFDSDYDTECPRCEEEDIEVAPGVYQSKEDYEANRSYDESVGN